MIKDIIKDFTKYINERASNPFIGAFIISWCAHNWELLYSVFVFDHNFQYQDKISFIQDYIDEKRWFYLLWSPIIFALSAILIIPVFQNISLLIITFFKRWGKPLVFYLVDRNKIIDKATFDDFREEFGNLQTKYDKIKDENIKYKSESENSEEKNSTLNVENAKMLLELKKIKKDLTKEKQLHKYEQETKKQPLKDLFEGKWLNEYIAKDGSMGKEEVEIKDSNKYYAHGKHYFNLDMIEVNNKKKTLKFRKISPDKTRVAINDLKIKNKKLYEGLENNTTKIKYSKITASKNETEKFILSNQLPPQGFNNIDDHYYPQTLNFNEYIYEIEVKPNFYIEHWRLGIVFSKNLNFRPKEKRHQKEYPIFHLEKDEKENVLKVSYYDENMNNPPTTPLDINNYKVQPVILKPLLENNTITIDVLDKNKKSILQTPQKIENYSYGQLFAWGDNRNEFRIEAILNRISKY